MVDGTLVWRDGHGKDGIGGGPGRRRRPAPGGAVNTMTRDRVCLCPRRLPGFSPFAGPRESLPTTTSVTCILDANRAPHDHPDSAYISS